MRTVLLCCVLLILAPGAAADVLTVGPGGAFADIQSAVDAAADGDIVLVSSGTYGPVNILATGLTVVAEADARVIVDGGILVSSVPAGRTVSLVNLSVVMNGSSGAPWPDAYERATLLFGACDGSIRVDGCQVTGPGGPSPFSDLGAFEVALIQACDDVSFARCSLTGGLAIAAPFVIDPAPPGVSVIGSTVSLHDSSVTGAIGAGLFGPSTDGGPGLAITSGSVFVSGSTITGGEGGAGSAKCVLDAALGGENGQDGGAGVALLGPAARLTRLDSVVSGGAGGPGGVDAPEIFCFGTADGQPGVDLDLQAGLEVPLPGAAHGISLPTPAREFEPLTLTLQGQPGELAGTFWSLGTDSFFKLGLRGQVLLDFAAPTFLIVVGSVPPGGELSVPFVYDDLGPGFDGLTIHFQSVFGGVDGTYLAAPQAAVILDETL